VDKYQTLIDGTYRVEYTVAAPGLYDFVVQQVSTGYFLGSDAAKFGLFPTLVDGFRRNYVTPFSVQIRKVGPLTPYTPPKHPLNTPCTSLNSPQPSP